MKSANSIHFHKPSASPFTRLTGLSQCGQAYLADTAGVSISSGAKLHLNFTGTDTIATLTLGGVAMPPGPYNSTTHASNFLGSGSLVVPTNFTNWLNLFPTLPVNETSPTADPDHDGLQNLIEYALGTAPNTSQQNAISSAISSQLLSLTFDRLPARSDLTIEATSTLGTWTPIARSTAGAAFIPLLAGVQCLEIPVDANRFRVTVTDAPPATASRFLRIVVNQ